MNVSHAPLADRTLADVLTALASDAASPGSGAAAAVALSFAAACAGKALAISRKHRPESSQGAEQRAADLIRRSLERADADAKHFEEFIHHKSAQAANELLCADEKSQSLARELGTLLDEVEPTIHPIVATDIAAARLLLSAAAAIEERVQAENRAAVHPKG